MKPRILIFALFLFSTPAFAADAGVDIPALADKTKSEVATMLGKPRDCEPSEYGERCYYPAVDTTIYYDHGKVTRVIITSMNRVEKLPFDESALEYLGLKSEKPTMKDKSAIIWCPIQGLKSVTLLRDRAIVIYGD